MTENPYETPRYESSGPVLPDVTYYRPVTNKLTVREFRNLSKNWAELTIGLAFKFLGLPLPTTHAIAENQLFLRLQPSDVSEPARQSLEPVVEEALALGMQYGFTYSFATVGTTETCAVALQSADGCVLMSIVYFRHWTALAVEERVRTAFASLPVDGRILVTAGHKPDLQRPPNYEVEYYPDKPLDEVLARHRARLEELKSALTPIQNLTDFEQALAEHEQEEFDFLVARGIYREVTPRQLERLRRMATSVTPPANGAKRHPVLSWISVGFWIVLLISLFTLPDPAVNPARSMTRLFILIAALAGIGITWLLRSVSRDRAAK